MAPFEWQRVYSLVEDSDAYYDALDYAMGALDDLRLERAYASLGWILSTCDLERCPTTFVLMALSVTTPIADKVPGREAFYQKVKAHLTATRPDEVDSLLRGYEGTPDRMASSQAAHNILDAAIGRLAAYPDAGMELK